MSSVAKVQNQIEFYKSKGAEFVGAVARLNCSVTQPITLQQIRQVFFDSPILPDEWAPEAECDFRLYLRTMTETGRSTRTDKLQRDHAGALEFDEVRHAGYIVRRVHKAKNDEYPTSHSIIHLERNLTPKTDADGNIIFDRLGNPVMQEIAVEADDGIRMVLHRKEGTPEQDSHGTNTWGYVFTKPNGDQFVSMDAVPPQYYPFLRTVARDWKAKRERVYKTAEIREMLLDVIINKMKFDSVDTAMYFCSKYRLAQARELRDRIKELDPGLRLWLFELPVWPEGTAGNDMVEMVSTGLLDTLTKDLKKLLDDLKNRDGDTDTRQSTWNRRREELLELRRRIREYSRIKLMSEDTLKAQFAEAKDIIMDNVEQPQVEAA